MGAAGLETTIRTFNSNRDIEARTFALLNAASAYREARLPFAKTKESKCECTYILQDIRHLRTSLINSIGLYNFSIVS